jgi:hypothetical protein
MAKDGDFIMRSGQHWVLGRFNNSRAEQKAINSSRASGGYFFPVWKQRTASAAIRRTLIAVRGPPYPRRL